MLVALLIVTITKLLCMNSCVLTSGLHKVGFVWYCMFWTDGCQFWFFTLLRTSSYEFEKDFNGRLALLEKSWMVFSILDLILLNV